MAINLSRSFAKPCDILCDLTIDDVAISQTQVYKAFDTVVAAFQDQMPSIKFNGEGYSCEGLFVKAPSWHTIEDIRADAELVALCKNPQGKTVLVSTLLRTNSGSSRMNTFLNGFIPQANDGPANKVQLPPDWSLTQMVPPEPAQYSYRGNTPGSRGGETVQWVVFRSMGNIDPNTQAHLTKVAGAVPTPNINRTQEVFFNDIQHIAGVPDGKAYMKCRRVKKKGEQAAERITPVKGVEDLAAKRAAEEDKSSTTAYLKESLGEYAKSVGGYPMLALMAVLVLAGIVGLWQAWQTIQGENGLVLAKQAQGAASQLRGKTAAAAEQATTLAKVASAKASNLAIEGAKQTTTLAKVAAEKSSTLAIEGAKQAKPLALTN